MSSAGKLLVVFLFGVLSQNVADAQGEKTQCGFNQWQCIDGTCIYNIGRCDAYPDCQDGSDELHCKNDVCREGLRKCSSGECIEDYKFCDGVTHCKDDSDELAADCHVNISKSVPEQKHTTAVNTTESVTTTTTTQTSPFVAPFRVDVTQTPRPLPTSPERPKPTTLTRSIPKPQTDSNNVNKLEVPYKMSPEDSQKPISSFVNRVPYTIPATDDQFSPTTVKYPCVYNYEAYEFCHRRYRGYFKHPTDCSKYIVCEWGFMHVCTCPEQTHWDGNILTCVWDYAAPCDNEPVPPQVLRIIHETRRPPVTRPPTTVTTAVTTTVPNNNPTVTPIMVPPQVRLRSALPVTPPWLKKLSEQSVLINRDKHSPQYKSLLSRFFKAIPVDNINKPTSDGQRVVK